ncbi:hypothetical protein C0995_008947 [Termitomyces sp. Mi166|nr:hypothetical protein C0995_008947 [Termitomyces sp. Mi166\
MTAEFSESVLILPDILAEWPWKRNINPLSGSQVKAEATEWIQSFIVSTPRMQQVFDIEYSTWPPWEHLLEPPPPQKMEDQELPGAL